jgi:hypothetical protein
MRSLIVVVPKVLCEHPAEVAFRRDQHPVQALAPAAPDPSFGMRVRTRCYERRQDHSGSVRTEDAIEAARELPIVVVHDQAELDPASFSCQLRFRACCVTHAAFGSEVQAADRTRREPRCTNMSTYSRLKNTVSTLKKSVATKVSACAARNCF